MKKLVKVLVISDVVALAEEIFACLKQFEGFAALDISCNGVTGLRAIASQLPELVFIVAPLPDRVLGHVIKEAKRRHPGVRIILIADWTEFAGFARANKKEADGFISVRLLSRELPLVLAQYPQLAVTWERCFSPWKAAHAMF